MADWIPFVKMSGAGNDFIIIDNRGHAVADDQMAGFAAKVCARGVSVGADGLILLEDSRQADFRWQFFNSDGSRGEMCGNGARCAARYAFIKKIAPSPMSFETDAGLVRAEVAGQSVRLEMTRPSPVELGRSLETEDGPLQFSYVNTGVPHVVVEVEHLKGVDVKRLGRVIRNHRIFLPGGTNVNFIAALKSGRWGIRTYERGVEDETLACGTGSVAAALVLAASGRAQSPVNLQTASGVLLRVYFRRKDSVNFDQVLLEGDARFVYEARMGPDAWKY